MADNEPSDPPVTTGPDDPARQVAEPAIGPWQRLFAALRRRQRVVVLVVAAILVLLRTAVFLFFEGSFNSDQAVTGLMTTHLIEGRAFPVFKYGQDYQLAVQVWMAAPLFMLFGPSEFLLRLPLLLVNIGLATLLIQLLQRELGLRPWMALLVATPFLLAPPGTSMQLVEPSGGNVEPLLMVPLLWLLRRHPLTFGAVLAIGFLQRVFALYALGALLLVELADGSLFSRATATRYLRSAFAFAAVWQTVGLVRAVAGSDFGPSTPVARVDLPALTSVAASSNVNEALGRFCWDPGGLPHRVVQLFGDHLATMFGGRRVQLSGLGVPSASEQGLDGLWLLVGGVLLCALARLLWRTARGQIRPWHGRPQFALYLFLTGVLTVGALLTSRCGSLDIHTLRYTLHTLLAVVGLVGGFLATESSPGARRLVVAVLTVWTLAAAWGHGRLLAEFRRDPPQDYNRVLAEYLVEHDIRYGFADYWDAYSTVFWADEQVILASTTVVFIKEYEQLALDHLDEAVWIYREPCDGGLRITEIHYMCGP